MGCNEVLKSIAYAILLGSVEGSAEFIPVSSTAHRLILQRLLKIPADANVFAFLVLVQLGPLLALIACFRKDYWSLIKAFFAIPSGPRPIDWPDTSF